MSQYVVLSFAPYLVGLRGAVGYTGPEAERWKLPAPALLRHQSISFSKYLCWDLNIP